MGADATKHRGVMCLVFTHAGPTRCGSLNVPLVVVRLVRCLCLVKRRVEIIRVYPWLIFMNNAGGLNPICSPMVSGKRRPQEPAAMLC